MGSFVVHNVVYHHPPQLCPGQAYERWELLMTLTRLSPKWSHNYGAGWRNLNQALGLLMSTVMELTAQGGLCLVLYLKANIRQGDAGYPQWWGHYGHTHKHTGPRWMENTSSSSLIVLTLTEHDFLSFFERFCSGTVPLIHFTWFYD